MFMSKMFLIIPYYFLPTMLSRYSVHDAVGILAGWRE